MVHTVGTAWRAGQADEAARIQSRSATGVGSTVRLFDQGGLKPNMLEVHLSTHAAVLTSKITRWVYGSRALEKQRQEIRKERRQLQRERDRLERVLTRIRRQREKQRLKYEELRRERKQLQAERQFPLRTQLGSYHLGALIAQGTESRVYAARDARDGKEVALKLVSAELSEAERFRQAWQRQASVVSTVNHANIIKVYETGKIDGQPYIAMQLTRGGDLRALLVREVTLTPERTLHILGQVAAALDAIHACGQVHGDVTAGNILLDADDTAYLTDFWRAPDRSFDLHQLGWLFYVCLSRPPGGTPSSDEDDQTQGVWTDRDVTRRAYPKMPPSFGGVGAGIWTGLDRAITKALSGDPDDGYPDCTSLVRAVEMELTQR